MLTPDYLSFCLVNSFYWPQLPDDSAFHSASSKYMDHSRSSINISPFPSHPPELAHLCKIPKYKQGGKQQSHRMRSWGRWVCVWQGGGVRSTLQVHLQLWWALGPEHTLSIQRWWTHQPSSWSPPSLKVFQILFPEIHPVTALQLFAFSELIEDWKMYTEKLINRRTKNSRKQDISLRSPPLKWIPTYWLVIVPVVFTVLVNDQNTRK